MDECQLKEAQIKELQSKLADARESRSRQQSRLLQITSIAEARAVMKHLFSLVSIEKSCGSSVALSLICLRKCKSFSCVDT